MRGIAVVLCLGVAAISGACNDEQSKLAQAEAEARGRLQYVCKGVYKSVEKIDTCNTIAQNHYDLEQKYFPGEPEKVADTVLADLFPSAAENERRRHESMAKGASYAGPPPSELYEILR
ncbi:MAG TPA: hypothetical protein VHC71_05750 [Hyphomicrobium sp.]|nr:hypothetical protein [Hyphomicrobium sp.]